MLVFTNLESIDIFKRKYFFIYFSLKLVTKKGINLFEGSNLSQFLIDI